MDKRIKATLMLDSVIVLNYKEASIVTDNGLAFLMVDPSLVTQREIARYLATKLVEDYNKQQLSSLEQAINLFKFYGCVEVIE